MIRKRGILVSVLFLVVLLCVSMVSATLLDRGAYWNKFDNGGQSYSLEIYNNIINILNGSDYTPIDTQINSSNYLNFVYELTNTPYKAYFRNNSNQGGTANTAPVRFEKDGYFFAYDISGGRIQWREQPGFPSRTDTLGGGAPSNSQDSFAVINNNILTYPDAFYNTNVTYILSNDVLKETFILSGLPSLKDYNYLEYTGKAYFNRSLKICANDQCYIPSGTQDDFSTSGRIEFKDENDLTIFYLEEPVITDSNGTSILGLYYVHGSDAQMGFDLRINKTFLETAVFPIYIDPSIRVGGGSGGDAYVDKSTANRNHGEKDELKVQKLTWQRTYSRFNISSIPANQVIDDASLCLYLFSDLGSQTISVNHVYDNSWCEGDGGTDGSPACEITWNNQPCGADELVIDSGSCNSTVESTITTDTFMDNTWQCWNITKMVRQEYNSNNDNISMVLWTTDTGSADKFHSKEYADSSLWPYLNVTYHTSNNIPTVSSMSLTPAQPNTTERLTCAFTITDGDAGDSLSANITWYKEGSIHDSENITVTNGTEELSMILSSNTAKNEGWNCTVIPYDGTTYGNEASEKVTIKNSPPTKPNISLTPTSPDTEDTLLVGFNQYSQDNDSDSITYTYLWYQNGSYKAEYTGLTVPSGATSKNEVWVVNVTAYDEEEYSEKDTDTITIQNTPPSITSASIAPTTAYETTTLTASTSGWSDLDNVQDPNTDQENYIYQWFNGSEKIDGATSPTLTGTDFNKGDQIKCNVTPWDSDGYGASEMSNTVTIENSLPVIDSISISSELGFNGTDEYLTGSFTYSDGDSDTISNNETKWFKDDVEQTNLAGLTVLSYTNTSADDVWVFSVRVNDGGEWGNWYNASMTILDVSQTYPTLISPSNGTYFNVNSIILKYRTPNYADMDCTIYADNNSNPITPINNEPNVPARTRVIYNWEDMADNIYYWKVGCNNGSLLLNSTVKAFTVDTTYPITAPTLMSVSDSDKDGNIELSWTVDSDAITYNIYRSSAEILDVVGLTAVASVSGITWEDNTTLHDNSYWYALTTVDGAGNENKSVVSDSFNATANDTIKPKLADSVDASSLNGVTTINWGRVRNDVNDNSDESSLQYKIWYRQNSTVNLSKSLVSETADYVKIVGQDSCLGDSCSTTHSLSSSMMYYYFVTTIDDGDNENLTLENNYANVTATTAPPGDPGGSGGSGGGGGGSSRVKKDCKEDWSCSGWYSCVNDVQARTCVDINGCGTDENKPEDKRDCGDCIEEWQCGDWTACVNNRQTKVCVDKNDCKTEKSKPEEEEECNLDTCSDEVKNYGEVGVDCGGPCRPCKVSDFITGGAVALNSTKGPNRKLLIPTMLLLVAFLVIKTVRKSSIKFARVASIMRVPMIILIAGLFIFSFFGPQITGLFVADDETINKPLEHATEGESESVPEISGLGPDVEFDQRKGRIVSMVFFVIISLVLGGLFVRKRFPDKFKFGSFRVGKKEEIMLSEEQIEQIEEDIEKSAKMNLVEDVLKEMGVREEPTNGVTIEIKKPDKQGILNDLKDAYKIER